MSPGCTYAVVTAQGAQLVGQSSHPWRTGMLTLSAARMQVTAAY
jgi:hypothetical protein